MITIEHGSQIWLPKGFTLPGSFPIGNDSRLFMPVLICGDITFPRLLISSNKNIEDRVHPHKLPLLRGHHRGAECIICGLVEVHSRAAVGIRLQLERVLPALVATIACVIGNELIFSLGFLKLTLAQHVPSFIPWQL